MFWEEINIAEGGTKKIITHQYLDKAIFLKLFQWKSYVLCNLTDLGKIIFIHGTTSLNYTLVAIWQLGAPSF